MASGAIGAVNPNVPATVRVFSGMVTGPDGTRTPAYTDVPGTAQVQATSYKDLQQTDGMNLNGERRTIFFNGAYHSTSRVGQQGGDLVVLTDGVNAGTWLIAYVAEQWPDWCKLICTLQNGA